MVRNKYTLIDKINLFINIYARLFTAIFRFSWWSPFFILALIQILGLAGFFWYYIPVWINIIYPILSIFVPESAFHYPQYYLALPSIYSAYDIFILGPTAWLILMGAAFYRLGHTYDGTKRPFKECVRASMKKYLPLLAVWLIETVLVFLILYIPVVLLNGQIGQSPRRIMALRLLLQMAGFIISAMFIYAIPGIIIDNKKLSEALGNSFRLFFKNIFFTYFIVLIPGIVMMIFNLFLTDLAPKIITLFNPDLIPAILVASIVIGIFTNLFTYGGAVIAYKKFNE
jgi:hypothetical protein